MVTPQPTIKKDDAKIYPEIEYFGVNGHDVYKKLWPDGEPERLPLEPSLKLRDHSPTGFTWGYNGAGCNQLGLALLLDATSDPDLALSYYPDFTQQIVAGWDFNGSWMIFRADILNWLKLTYGRELEKRLNKN